MYMSLTKSNYISGKKGQFFLIGALLFSMVFYLGISARFSENIVVRHSDLKYLYNNIEKEYTHVFNLGLNESDELEKLVNFTIFIKNIARERNINFESLVIFTKNDTEDLEVTLINNFDNQINITINVSDDVKNVSLNSGSYTILSFSPPDEFVMEIMFNNTKRELLLEKYKANIYFIISLRRGDDVIKGDFLA